MHISFRMQQGLNYRLDMMRENGEAVREHFDKVLKEWRDELESLKDTRLAVGPLAEFLEKDLDAFSQELNRDQYIDFVLTFLR